MKINKDFILYAILSIMCVFITIFIMIKIQVLNVNINTNPIVNEGTVKVIGTNIDSSYDGLIYIEETEDGKISVICMDAIESEEE